MWCLVSGSGIPLTQVRCGVLVQCAGLIGLVVTVYEERSDVGNYTAYTDNERKKGLQAQVGDKSLPSFKLYTVIMSRNTGNWNWNTLIEQL